MSDRKFFVGLPDISQLAGAKLEEIVAGHNVIQKHGRLFFNYFVNMELAEEKPLVADEDGNFWIGKMDHGTNLVFEEYGSSISRLLGCPSPQVDFALIDGRPYIMSRFVHPSSHPIPEEMREKGQAMLVPRLLASYSAKIDNSGELLKGRLDCDASIGQFLIDREGTLHQVDFSRPEERAFDTNHIKWRLNHYGLSANQDNPLVKGQLDAVAAYDSTQLYHEFTPISQLLFPSAAKQYSLMFFWNFNNIRRLLLAIDSQTGEYMPYKTIILQRTVPKQ